MRFYPMYLTEHEIDILLTMVEDLEVHKAYSRKEFTHEEKRMQQLLTITLQRIRENNKDGD